MDCEVEVAESEINSVDESFTKIIEPTANGIKRKSLGQTHNISSK